MHSYTSVEVCLCVWLMVYRTQNLSANLDTEKRSLSLHRIISFCCARAHAIYLCLFARISSTPLLLGLERVFETSKISSRFLQSTRENAESQTEIRHGAIVAIFKLAIYLTLLVWWLALSSLFLFLDYFPKIVERAPSERRFRVNHSFLAFRLLGSFSSFDLRRLLYPFQSAP